MKDLPLADVYRLIEPGPVVLLVTASDGRANVMTMSWHMMMEFEPPLLACVVSENNYSFRALAATKQCVIAVPPVELAAKVTAIGNCSGHDVDKLAKFSLAMRPAACVGVPLLADCLANLECRVVDTRLVDDYNLFVLEVVKAWTRSAHRRSRTIHHAGRGRFVVDGETIRLKSRMR